ncbi:signal peptidase II [Tissierella praeacuta]|uniref:signal peptidase II n=1 Tax=Tissierella praeacuta TaxID=43131 RepID=UPI00333FE34C
MIFILSIVIILLDQISKYAAIKYLKESVSHVIIPNYFRLTYVENFGAAFGILQNKKIFFIIITCAVVFFLILFLTKNYYKINIFMRIGLGMLLGGTIGNFIDRIRFGYVVDFFSFRLFNRYEFPVFNIADIAIVLGTFIILILVLFDRYEA